MTYSLNGLTLTVTKFDEDLQAVETSWDTWQNQAFARKYQVFGTARSWTLACVENNIAWTSSQAKSLQDAAATGASVPFVVSDSVRTINTTVLIMDVKVTLQDIANQNIRNFSVSVVEASVTPVGGGGGGGSGGSSATIAAGSFTITAGNIQATVTHTLGAVPTAVVVSPVTDCGGKRWSVPSRSSSQFIISLDSKYTSDIIFNYVCA